MAEVDRVAEDEGLKQSLRRYAIESGAIMERVYRKEMELPIENMKQFLDGILHTLTKFQIFQRTLLDFNGTTMFVKGKTICVFQIQRTICL